MKKNYQYNYLGLINSKYMVKNSKYMINSKYIFWIDKFKIHGKIQFDTLRNVTKP